MITKIKKMLPRDLNYIMFKMQGGTKDDQRLFRSVTTFFFEVILKNRIEVRFNRGASRALIIDFDGTRTEAYVGIDAFNRAVDGKLAISFKSGLAERTLERRHYEIIHELCHTLGFKHGQLSIKSYLDKRYEDLVVSSDIATVVSQLERLRNDIELEEDEDQVVYYEHGGFDADSMMLYYLKCADFATDPYFCERKNRYLSSQDYSTLLNDYDYIREMIDTPNDVLDEPSWFIKDRD